MPIFAKGEVVQEFAAKVKKGMKVKVEDDAYEGDVYEGTITRLSPWMGPKRIMFQYSAEVAMSLKYNDKRGQIIFSHLAPKDEGSTLEAK